MIVPRVSGLREQATGRLSELLFFSAFTFSLKKLTVCIIKGVVKFWYSAPAIKAQWLTEDIITSVSLLAGSTRALESQSKKLQFAIVLLKHSP